MQQTASRFGLTAESPLAEEQFSHVLERASQQSRYRLAASVMVSG